MGTRSTMGFRINGQDKVTYNQMDGYWEGVGRAVLQSLAGLTIPEMKAKAAAIELVQDGDGDKPTPAQQKALKQWSNTNVSSHKLDEWYVLLREAQGDLSAWLRDGLPYMIDSHTFLADSLFCEYAYIVNLDDEVFEVYVGSNKSRKAGGRYAKLRDKDPNGKPSEYYGVALVIAVPLADVSANPAKADEQIQAAIKVKEGV